MGVRVHEKASGFLECDRAGDKLARGLDTYTLENNGVLASQCSAPDIPRRGIPKALEQWASRN